MIRVCAEPGCPLDASSGRRYCLQHDRVPWEGQPHWRTRYPPDWKQLRLAVLARDPVCAICGIAPSREVDHVGGRDDNELGNLRGVCSRCHRRRSARQGRAAAKG